MAIMTSVRSRPYLFSLLIFILLLTIASLPWSASEQGRSDARTFLQKTTSTTASDKNDDLLVYVYYETPEAKINLQFFIDHAVHDKMDFIFVINGDELSVDIPKRHNFEVIRRENKCFDLGAMGEVLWADYARLRSRYKRFILTNASVRGPFMPAWAQQYGLCWSDIYFNYITDTTKLVGLSSNCAPMFTPHIQSMLLAVDRVGLDLIKPALRCAVNFYDAVGNGETKLTSLVRNAGFGAMPMTAETRGKVYDSTEDYWRHCDHGDLFFPNKYYGMDVHPYDSIFAKVHRTVIDATTPPTSYSPAGLVVLEKLTEWANTGNYSSYDFCKR